MNNKTIKKFTSLSTRLHKKDFNYSYDYVVKFLKKQGFKY